MLFVYAYLLQLQIKSSLKAYNAQKSYLIIMQEPISYTHHRLQIDQEDLQALDLFNNLEQEHSKSQQAIQQNQQLNQSHNSEDNYPKLSRLSKHKPESKKQKKNRKLKQKHKLKKKKHRHIGELSSPKKKIKRDRSNKKQNDDEEQKLRNDGDPGSSQFDSQSNNSDDLNNELRNLNPDNAQNNSLQQDPSPKKRLIKSGRKQRIQEKEGFKIQELGNEAQLQFSNESDESFDGKKRKTLKGKKLKLKVPTNEQIMNAFKEHGVVESEGEDEAGKQRQYDSGLDMLNSLKSKKSSNGIRINNRLFGDLQINLQQEQANQMPLPQNLELELKPKASASSQRFSFLSRAETIKKQRGLQADINHQQFQRRAQEKAKKSMAKVVSSMVSQDFHEDLDVEIRVPTIARGKSADIINNTVFLRKFANKLEGNQISLQPQIPLTQTKSFGPSSMVKKDTQTRSDFFKQIQQQNRLRRSKHISQEELKNSFKKTNLEELQQARKRIQQKKKKQALSDESENEEEIDSNLQQMIEKQEMACEQQEEDQNKEGKMQEVKIAIQVPLEKGVQNEIKNKQDLPQEQEQNQNQELQQYNEVIQQLHNVSDDQEKLSEEKDQQEEPESMENENKLQQSEINQQQEEVANAEIIPQVDQKENQENERLMRQLQEQGIITRKRGANKPKVVQQNIQENQTPAKLTFQDQENITPEDKHNVQLVSTDKKYYDEQNQDFNEFRKLRKIAIVIAKKKKQREQGKKYAAQFIQNEAQEGSDNQDHDDFVKKIDYDAEQRQYEGIDLDADLEQLIDNAVDLNEEDQNQAFRKYLQDVRLKDREEIKKIIRGEFHKKHQDLQLEMEQDEKKRLERMQEVMNWMKQREEEQGQNMYLKQPEPEQINSQDQSAEIQRKKNKTVQIVQEEQKINVEEEQARLERFLSQTMPTSKKQLKPAKELNFLPLPESVKFQKRPSSQKAISMSKLGSKVVPQMNSQQLMSRKNTSSLVNKILSQNNHFKPKPLLAVTTKPTKKK